MTSRALFRTKFAAAALSLAVVTSIGCGDAKNGGNGPAKDAAFDPATTEQVTIAVTGMT